MKVHNPLNLNELLNFLDKKGEETCLLAGGTDLVGKLKEKSLHCRTICNLQHTDELHFIKEEENYLRIGALTTHREIMTSPLIRQHMPLLAEASATVGSPQIRNKGTIGGNIINASPAADTVPALMVLGAKLQLLSLEGEREVPIKDFFTGPERTDLKSSELLAEITIPKLTEGDLSFYSKLGQRNALAISIVGVAAVAKLSARGIFAQVKIALGSVGPTVICSQRCAQALAGKKFTPEELWETTQIVKEEVNPISDVRASAHYRKEMAAALLYQGLKNTLRTWFELKTKEIIRGEKQWNLLLMPGKF